MRQINTPPAGKATVYRHLLSNSKIVNLAPLAEPNLGGKRFQSPPALSVGDSMERDVAHPTTLLGDLGGKKKS